MPIEIRLGALIVTATLGCRASDEPRPDLVLANVTVVDGRGGPPVPGRTIEVRGGRITAIRDASPQDRGTVDAAGQFVLPGLIDAHLHLGHLGDGLPAVLDSLLRGGITSGREMACCADLYQPLDTQVDTVASPRLFYSAFWADSIFFAVDPRVRSTPNAGRLPWFLAVDGRTDLAAALGDARGIGVTGVKIYSNLAAPLVTAIAAEGRRQGVRVWSHPVVFPTRPSLVIAAGVDVISHASLLVWEGASVLPPRYDGDHRFNAFGPPAPYRAVPPDAPAVLRVLDSIRARGVILDATISTVRLAVSEDAFIWASRVTAAAHRLGIPIAAGTDRSHFVDGQPALFAELEALVDAAGLTPLEAITAATRNGARVLGREADLGTIEVGKIADLVVVGADPTRQIRNARQVTQVIKGGRVVRR